MRVFSILFRKEFKNYFLTPFGWVVLALVLFMQGMSMSSAMEQMKDAPMLDNFLLLTLRTPNFWFYFLFIFPLLTMRLFAEEAKTGTLETLMTAPVTTTQVVFSKYLAALCFYSLLWLPILLHLKIFAMVTGQPAPVETGTNHRNLRDPYAHGGIFPRDWLLCFHPDIESDRCRNHHDHLSGHLVLSWVCPLLYR